VTPAIRRAATAIGAAVGVALFIYAVRAAGVSEIAAGIQRVGWGLLVILAIGGARFLIRAECWRQCLPPETRLTFGNAFMAFLAGDAVGTVTPLGLLASEPTKIFLTRHHLATRESVSSLALENLVYAASVIAMVAIGIVVMLASMSLSPAWRTTLIVALVGIGAAAAVATIGLRTGLGRLMPRSTLRGKVSAVRQELQRVSDRMIASVFGLDLAFHALAVLEVFVTLRWLLGDRSPTLAQALIFAALDRVLTVVFKFVPFRVGVDEAFTGGLAPVLGVNPVAGVTLAVVRKVRNLFWAGVGLVFVATHPARSR
jgi:hypothetical protein